MQNLLRITIIKNIINVSAFNIIAAFLGFLLNIFLARYYNVEEYGSISFFLATFVILYTFFEFGFSNTLVILKSNTNETNKSLVSHYINYKFVNYSTILLVLALTTVFLLNNFLNLYFDSSIFLIFSAYFFSIARYSIAQLQVDQQWKKYNLLNLSNNLIKFILILLAITISEYIFHIHFKKNYFYITFLLYTIILLIVTHYNINFQFKKNIYNKKFKNKFLRTILALGSINIVIILAMRVDIYLIKWKLNDYYLGIYSAANSIAMIFPLITSSIMRVLLPESAKEGDSYLIKILDIQKKYFLYVIILIIIIIVLAQYIIPFVLGNKYLHSIPIFQLFIPIYIGGIFFTPLESYFFAKKQITVLIIRVIQILIISIAGYLLISHYNIIGIVIAIIMSRVFAWIYFTVKSYKILKL